MICALCKETNLGVKIGRGHIMTLRCRITSDLVPKSLSRFSPKSKSKRIHFNYFSPNQFSCCSCLPKHDSSIVDLSKYKQTFSKRMSMAGLKPHHRIALGVSGGPDSMALCVLAADWKYNGLKSNNNNNESHTKENSQFVDGLLAIVVDHGFRTESKDEANLVCRRLLNMGIRCEIATCEWSDGKPKQGHLQEEARTARYQIFQRVCLQNQIGSLLVAHHADDQAELFILRLSRGSGVLGLAGMAFTSQLFSPVSICNDESSNEILLCRPLLEFSKEDMYKICEGGNQEWVEDPTNQSTLFARNRIRISLNNFSSSTFKSELQAVISACRKTRSHVDQIFRTLICQSVTIMHPGYAVIDLESLNPLKIKDIYLSKFIAVLLQFISQKQSPVRSSAMKLVLDFIRTLPCKNSLTAAGCYLCADPGSKGTKVLICSSFASSSSPSELEYLYPNSFSAPKISTHRDLEQILSNQESNKFITDESEVHFLDGISSESVLIEAKRLNILSDSTHSTIQSLRGDEIERFKPKPSTSSDSEIKNRGKENVANNSLNPKLIRPGQVGYFNNRFCITWGLVESHSHHHCCNDGADDVAAEVRNMVEGDWLYLAELAKRQDDSWNYATVSAQKALTSIKSIPVAVRKGLPVLLNPQGLLLSIPCVGFKHCCCMEEVSAVFKPRVPLGGGRTSFL